MSGLCWRAMAGAWQAQHVILSDHPCGSMSARTATSALMLTTAGVGLGGRTGCLDGFDPDGRGGNMDRSASGDGQQ